MDWQPCTCQHMSRRGLEGGAAQWWMTWYRQTPPTILRNKNGHPGTLATQSESFQSQSGPPLCPSHARREPPVKDDPVSPAAELIGCALLAPEPISRPLADLHMIIPGVSQAILGGPALLLLSVLLDPPHPHSSLYAWDHSG